jgi:hypothetical protein
LVGLLSDRYGSDEYQRRVAAGWLDFGQKTVQMLGFKAISSESRLIGLGRLYLLYI